MIDLMHRLNPTSELQRPEMAGPLTRQIVLITPARAEVRQPIAALTGVVTDVVGALLKAPVRRR